LKFKSGKSLKALQDFSENFGLKSNKVNQVRSLQPLRTTGEPDSRTVSILWYPPHGRSFRGKNRLAAKMHTTWPESLSRSRPAARRLKRRDFDRLKYRESEFCLTENAAPVDRVDYCRKPGEKFGSQIVGERSSRILIGHGSIRRTPKA